MQGGKNWILPKEINANRFFWTLISWKSEPVFLNVYGAQESIPRNEFRQPVAEPVFLNVYGAQESIPSYRFRQPMQPVGPVRQIGLSDRPPDWESILGLLKRSIKPYSYSVPSPHRLFENSSSGQTTYVLLRDRMEGAWLWTHIGWTRFQPMQTGGHVRLLR